MSDHPIRRLLQAARAVGSEHELSRSDFAEIVGVHPQKIAAAEAPSAQQATSMAVMVAAADRIREVMPTMCADDQRAWLHQLAIAVADSDDAEQVQAVTGMTLARASQITRRRPYVPAPNDWQIITSAWIAGMSAAILAHRAKSGAYAP